MKNYYVQVLTENNLKIILKIKASDEFSAVKKLKSKYIFEEIIKISDSRDDFKKKSEIKPSLGSHMRTNYKNSRSSKRFYA